MVGTEAQVVKLAEPRSMALNVHRDLSACFRSVFGLFLVQDILVETLQLMASLWLKGLIFGPIELDCTRTLYHHTILLNATFATFQNATFSVF
jgi:hypothetical protein